MILIKICLIKVLIVVYLGCKKIFGDKFNKPIDEFVFNQLIDDMFPRSLVEVWFSDNFNQLVSGLSA
jgi:hypothetical protein